MSSSISLVICSTCQCLKWPGEERERESEMDKGMWPLDVSVSFRVYLNGERE